MPLKVVDPDNQESIFLEADKVVAAMHFMDPRYECMKPIDCLIEHQRYKDIYDRICKMARNVQKFTNNKNKAGKESAGTIANVTPRSTRKKPVEEEPESSDAIETESELEEQ